MSLLRKDRWQEINTLHLLEGGVNYFSSLIGLIQAAKKEIFLEVYIFSADAQAEQIAKELADAARRGVEVRLIVDWIGSAPLPFEKMLRDAGVHFSYYNKAWFGKLGFSRTHRKIAVIDEAYAVVGGINICDDRLTSQGQALGAPRWDLAIVATGHIVEKVHATFLRQWHRLADDAMHLKNVIKRLLEHEAPWSSKHYLGIRHGNKPSIAFIARDNLHHRRDIERAYLKAIGQAQEEIWLVTPYFIPGRKLRKALIRAADRGVQVNLLIGKNEFAIVDWAVPSLYGQFLSSGISIYEHQKDQLHSKVMVVDRRWVTLGSSNCDPLSFLVNHEANWVIRNHAIIKDIRCKIADRAQESGSLVLMENFQRRSSFLKVLHWSIYNLIRLVMRIAAVGTRDKPLPWDIN